MIANVYRRIQLYISTKSKRIFIIPTRYGIYFLLTLFTLFLISLSFGHSLAFTTTFIFFSLIIVSAHFTNYNIDRITLSGLRGVHVVAGEDSIFEVLVTNDSNKWRFDMELSFIHSGDSESFSMRPYEKKIVQVKAKVSQRGAYNVEKMRISTTFPFGLFYAWSFKQVKGTFVCWPALSQEELTIPSAESYAQEVGMSNKVILGGSEEFYGHINFMPGMPPKGIDWKALARGRGKLFKQFVEYGGSHMIIDFSHVSGTLEEKVEKIARLIDLAELQGITYAFSPEGSEVKFGRGMDFKRQRLDELALFRSPEREML